MAASAAGGGGARATRARADDAGREGGPGADQRHRRHARHARRWRSPTWVRCCASRTSPRRCRSRRCSAPTGRSPPSCRRCARSRARRESAAQPARAAGRLADRRQPPRTATRACRTPTRCAARRRCTGAARDTLAHRARGRGRELALGDRQPDGAARRPRRVVTATSTARRSRFALRLPRDRRRRGRRDRASGAPTGCSTRARSHGLPPFLADDPGVDSGLMIAQYTQAAIVAERGASPRPPASIDPDLARCRRTTCRWAGAPHASCGGRSTRCADVSRSKLLCAARGLRVARPVAAGACDRRCGARDPRADRRLGAHRGEDRWLAPEIADTEELVTPARCCRRSRRSQDALA